MTRMTLAVMISMLLMAATVSAQDLGIRDTVRIDGDTLFIGESTPVTVSIVNDHSIRIFILPLKIVEATYCIFPIPAVCIPGGFARVDSIVWINRMADPRVLEVRSVSLQRCDGESPDTTVLGAMTMANPIDLAAGGDGICLIYLTGLIPGHVTVDSCSFLGQGIGMMSRGVGQHGQKYTPAFRTRSLLVAQRDSPPSLTLPSDGPHVGAGSQVSFDVAASSPQGWPVTVEIDGFTGLDGEPVMPVNPPTISGSDPVQFTWQPELQDVGLWLATFRACDSNGNCVSKAVDIQVVQSVGFLVPFATYETPGTVFGTSIAHGNLDGDSEPELFVGGDGWDYTACAATYDLVPGSGIFQQAWDWPPQNVIKGIQLGYFNSDDHLDAVMMKINIPQRVHVAYGDGNNSFPEYDNGESGVPIHGATLGEFTQDQYLDYVTVDQGGIRVFAGNSQGTFQQTLHLNLGTEAMSVNCADFDNDGYDDLAVGTENGLHIYLSDGMGGFYIGESYSQTYGTLDIEVTNRGSDFNGDNLFDLCLATPSVGGSHSQLVVYLGHGDGTFSQAAIRTPPGHVYANCAGDFNIDGLLDVAYINASRRYVAILFGDGDGTFANELRFDIPKYSPTRMDCLDVDLDGDLDIVVASRMYESGSSLFLLVNQLDPPGYVARSITIAAKDNAELQLTSPSGRVINKVKSSLSAASYRRRDRNHNEVLDDNVTVSAMEAGAYTVLAMPKPNLGPGEAFSLDVNLGTEWYRLAEKAPMAACGRRFTIYPDGSAPVSPAPGKFLYDNPPTFQWPGEGAFDFQLAADINFAELLVNVTVDGNSFMPSEIVAMKDTVTFFWRVKATETSGFGDGHPFNLISCAPTDVDDDEGAELPIHFALHQNYPNPFNPYTTFEYSIPVRCHVEFSVYNVLGQKVATLIDVEQGRGRHQASWNGTDAAGTRVASGVYLYRIKAGGYMESRKMTLLK